MRRLLCEDLFNIDLINIDQFTESVYIMYI